MRAHGTWVVILVMAVALLLTGSNGGIFRGGEVLAQVVFPPPFPFNVNFKCYTLAKGTNPAEDVRLCDQFHACTGTGNALSAGEEVTVRQSQLICTPARKCRDIGGVQRCEPAPAATVNFALKCYNIVPAGPPVNEEVDITDQFGTETAVKVEATQLLCEGATIKVLD